jgi:hypothetical protein
VRLRGVLCGAFLLAAVAGCAGTPGGKARADGAEEVVVDRDSTDGHPVAIRIDESKNAVDDETCYTISEYTVGGQPGPSTSPSR